MKRRTILAAGLGGALVAGATGLHLVRGDSGDDVPEVREPVPASPPAVEDVSKIKTVAYWTGIFMKSWDFAHGNATPLSRSKDSRDHYDLAYDVDACTAMFRATGQHRYLDRGLTWMENVVAASAPSTSLARSSFRDRYRGWGSSRAGGAGTRCRSTSRTCGGTAPTCSWP
ncbi:hypothetical protein [Actinoplanes sp. CA-252034]|uniref:hypothetical protein n=1 Tax=Actinoplanes sp. CA-252034 TaxID=3239906 RepID=UPI003D9702BF